MENVIVDDVIVIKKSTIKIGDSLYWMNSNRLKSRRIKGIEYVVETEERKLANVMTIVTKVSTTIMLDFDSYSQQASVPEKEIGNSYFTSREDCLASL